MLSIITIILPFCVYTQARPQTRGISQHKPYLTLAGSTPSVQPLRAPVSVSTSRRLSRRGATKYESIWRAQLCSTAPRRLFSCASSSSPLLLTSCPAASSPPPTLPPRARLLLLLLLLLILRYCCCCSRRCSRLLCSVVAAAASASAVAAASASAATATARRSRAKVASRADESHIYTMYLVHAYTQHGCIYTAAESRSLTCQSGACTARGVGGPSRVATAAQRRAPRRPPRSQRGACRLGRGRGRGQRVVVRGSWSEGQGQRVRVRGFGSEGSGQGSGSGSG